MKTSFYFVLWILIYPILGLFHSSFIDNNAFIVALAIVLGLSWLLNRLMPRTLNYERASQVASVLEDVYTGNVSSFRKRLVRRSTVETVAAVYFTFTMAVILLTIYTTGENDWIALIIFGLFTYGAIFQSVSLMRAKAKLKSNPTPEQCMNIAVDTYKLDYASYYDRHQGVSYAEMLPPRPKYYNAFQIISIVIASVALLLGLANIILALLVMFGSFISSEFIVGALAGLYFLYGSLAAYYGLKDIISSARAM